MLLSLLLSRLNRRRTSAAFVWSPSLDLSDNQIRWALTPSVNS